MSAIGSLAQNFLSLFGSRGIEAQVTAEDRPSQSQSAAGPQGRTVGEELALVRG